VKKRVWGLVCDFKKSPKPFITYYDPIIFNELIPYSQFEEMNYNISIKDY